MIEFDWMNLLQMLGGFVFGGGIVAFTKAGRAKTKAEAMKAMADAYEFRLESLHKVIENHNKSEIETSQRISDLNHALNEKEDENRKIEADKTEQIRKLTDKMYESEREVNRVNGLLNDAKDEITRLTEERDHYKACNEYNKRWRCEKSVCRDPEGRIPPNSKLASEVYVDPEKGRTEKMEVKVDIDLEKH